MHAPSEGVMTDFTTNPHVIPMEEDDGPLMKSDQALLMNYHEKLGHCSFQQLMVEKGMIPHKLVKVCPPKCPSCLYGKEHQKTLVYSQE